MKKNIKKLAFGILGLAIFGFGFLMFTGNQPATTPATPRMRPLMILSFRGV